MISSNPNHPLQPTAGITHTWMGESWMVDRETSVMMMAMISPLREGISPADFFLPESFFSLCGYRPMEAAEYFVDRSPRVLGLRGRYTRKGAARGGPGTPHHTSAPPQCWPCPRAAWAPRGPSRAPLFAPSVIWKNRDFCIFS